MAPKKVDVQLDESGLVQAVAAGLRAGSRVELRRNDEGGLYCVTEGGEVIGPIASAAAAAPAAAAAATATALGGTFGGAVRTVRRRLDDNAVVQVLVRFVEERARACKAGPAPPAAPAEETLDDPTTARLSHLQLEQIAADDEVRRQLHDEALQRAVAAVDGARDREAALAAALREPALRAFADRVLAAAAAPEPP